MSLSELARRADVPVRHLSQAISEAGGTSFNALITGRRLQAAKTLLEDPLNGAVAVEALGLEAGFRSRSAFYAAFRKTTGLTPVQYRDRAAGENVSSPFGSDMVAAASAVRRE